MVGSEDKPATMDAPSQKSSAPPSVTDSKDAVDTTAMPAEEIQESKEKSADEASPQQEDEDEYPKSWKLGFITTALCLSVFCMALVSFAFSHSAPIPLANPSNRRTTPSFPPPFRASLTSSKPSTMWAGTGLPIS